MFPGCQWQGGRRSVASRKRNLLAILDHFSSTHRPHYIVLSDASINRKRNESAISIVMKGKCAGDATDGSSLSRSWRSLCKPYSGLSLVVEQYQGPLLHDAPSSCPQFGVN